MTSRMFRGDELDRPRARGDELDPVAEGARRGLSRELSIAIWERVCAEATDNFGRRNEEQARQQFDGLTARVAARGGPLVRDVGRVTRVGVESASMAPTARYAGERRPNTPGRETLVAAETRPPMATPSVPGRMTLVANDAASPHLGFDDYRVLGLEELLRRMGPSHALRREVVEAAASADRRVAGRAIRWLEGLPVGVTPTQNGHALWQTSERHAATLYRRAVSSGQIDLQDPSVESALQQRGTGELLPREVRRAMEHELGVELAGVRIHIDAVAALAARALGAEAFTLGEDIFFSDGKFAPETPSGRQLLAHELTHVAQALRGSAGPAGDELQVSKPGEPLEQEADAVAARVTWRDPVATARAGTAGAGSRLPFSSQIQVAFGKHDISGVRSHIGGAATEASGALGARAFAVGDAVGFENQPDLHTAAHEAAHVVQQRRGVELAGGLDTPGDTYELHADAVADAVVAGQSAEALLDACADSGGGRDSTAVQRDTNAPPKAPQPDPPPPRGRFRVEVAGPGDYTFVFNSSDLRSASSPALVAFRFYMNDVFPGVTNAQIDAVFKSNQVFLGSGDPIPDGEHEYLVNIRPPFHTAIVVTMKRVAPHLHVVEPQVGAATLPGAAGTGGTGTGATGAGTAGGKTKGHLDHGGADEHTDAVSTTVEIDRALYDRLVKKFPEAAALHGPQAWPALLAFLADHAAELKQLPHTKAGVASLGVEQLEKLLDAFKQHQRETDNGNENGVVSGADEAKHGTDAGVDGGNENTTNTKGVKGGTEGGEGDSKYGWVRWVPRGEIGIQPQLPHYSPARS